MITGRRRLDQRGKENLLMRDQLEGMQAESKHHRARDADANALGFAQKNMSATQPTTQVREIFHEFDRDSLNAQAPSVNGGNNPDELSEVTTTNACE